MTDPIDDPTRFRDLVAGHGLGDQVHDIDFISGLLLALASGPELVSPTEWLPLVYTDEESEPRFPDQDAFREFFGELMLVWNHWNDEIETEDAELHLPSRYRLVDDEIPSEPLSNFARGVAEGYGWLQEDWENLFEEIGDAEVTEEFDSLYGMTLVATLVLAEPERIRQLVAEEGDTAPSPEQALTFLPACLKALAKIARSLSAPEFEEEETPAINPMRHVGRNDPCPCGSGKKYKKCCLN